MKNFDAYIGIDWSGAKQPLYTDAIALAIAEQGQTTPQLVQEKWSRTSVAEWLIEQAEGQKRLLVGIDCNFGYSEITGVVQFGKDYTASDLWNAVEDANKDEPNYFAGGYWTDEVHGKHFWISGKMPPAFAMPRRATETACGEDGLGWPESPFKLIGAKQVGKGGLAGMRLIRDLKEKLGAKVALWPFEHDTDKAILVITEIYPRLFLKLSGHGNAKVRDLLALNNALIALQSRKLTDESAFSDHQADAIVAAAGLRFLCGTAKTVPENLAHPPATRTTLEREGWIFGAGAKKR